MGGCNSSQSTDSAERVRHSHKISGSSTLRGAKTEFEVLSDLLNGNELENYMNIHHKGEQVGPLKYLILEWFDRPVCLQPAAEALSAEVWNLRHLQELRLHAFPYSRLPDEIGNLTALKYLALNGSALPRSDVIREISGAIGKLENLVDLSIIGCSRLEALPAEIGKLQRLERIFLCRVSLRELPPELCQLHSLKRLQLNDLAGLEILPRDLGLLKALESLTIIECPSLRQLPASVGFLQNLEHIKVTGRLAATETKIPPDIRQCSRLKVLEFCHLSPESLMLLFGKPWEVATNEVGCALEEISMSECGLDDAHCHTILPNLPRGLKGLNVSWNNISSLEAPLQANLPRQIRFLTMSNNPILESNDPKEQSNLVRLLDTHRALGMVHRRWSKGTIVPIFTPASLYLLFLNKCGRGLLTDDSNPLQLSLWPMVLENVNRSIPKDVHIGWGPNRQEVATATALRASVLYSLFLLHGPAFLQNDI
jgi:Leucine-rich repeat (LRR) protein